MRHLRLLMAGNTGLLGHLYAETTHAIVSGQFWWRTTQNDCKSFVTSCLHCLFSEPGVVAPRPRFVLNRPLPVIYRCKNSTLQGD